MKLRDVLPPASFAAVESALSWLQECRNAPIEPIPAYRCYRPGYRFTSRERSVLRQMAKSAVWQERGGLAIGARSAFEEQHGAKSRGEMQARTVWVGMPEWAKNWDMNNGAITAAVDKAIEGEKLGPRQRRLIQAMMDEMAEGDAIRQVAPECPF